MNRTLAAVRTGRAAPRQRGASYGDHEVGRDRLDGLRQRMSMVFRAVLRHRRRGQGLDRLVHALRQNLRWAAFKLEMLRISRGDGRAVAREEMDMVLGVLEQNLATLERLLGPVADFSPAS